MDAAATCTTSATLETLPLISTIKSCKNSIFIKIKFDPKSKNRINFGRTSSKRASEEERCRMERRVLSWCRLGNGSYWHCSQQRIHFSPFNGKAFYFLLLFLIYVIMFVLLFFLGNRHCGHSLYIQGSKWPLPCCFLVLIENFNQLGMWFGTIFWFVCPFCKHSCKMLGLALTLHIEKNVLDVWHVLVWHKPIIQRYGTRYGDNT